ncbi:hypothetical protein DPMN_093811 [Dreissena polymorpha]|uniref:Uncharacterized protein n=1 Tax=Dreissena polymorpha TaxID=45954 RepID=A0A9D4L491_DREPO|nr:hypothetical protein DPMN_093811 [Dreissena polymorpha]
MLRTFPGVGDPGERCTLSNLIESTTSRAILKSVLKVLAEFPFGNFRLLVSGRVVFCYPGKN